MTTHMLLYLGNDGDSSCRALLPIRMQSETLIQSWWPGGLNCKKDSIPVTVVPVFLRLSPFVSCNVLSSLVHPYATSFFLEICT